MLQVIPSPRSPVARVALLGGELAATATLRVQLGGADPAASLSAAIVFATLLTCLAVAAGTRPGAPRPLQVAAGAATGCVLFACWWVAAVPPLHPAAPSLPLLAWSPVVIAVAVSEEAVLRGAMFSAVQEFAGAGAAIAVSTVAFALLHVPLYGWGAVPVDLGVGALLGGLRLATGGVAAPAAAHALADLLGGWLG